MKYEELSDASKKFVDAMAEKNGMTKDEVLRHFEDLCTKKNVRRLKVFTR